MAQLQAQVVALGTENQALREELQRLQGRQEAVAQAGVTLLGGGARLLVPLLDRERVVRSFGKLAATISGFAGPPAQWPRRDQVLGETREFLESCVRFVIRRRLFVLLFSLLATAIPIIQIYLVMQQNEIIENQTRFAEMQVYDVVSRSMVDGNRNARLMTSALLSRSDLGFLDGVVDEAFDRDLGVITDREGVDAAHRRLEDAAFRGHVIRAVVRGIEARTGEGDAGSLYEQTRPMLARILADAADRVPVILRLGETRAEEIDGDLREQVDHYLVQVGEALRMHARLSRATDEEDAFAGDVEPFLARASQLAPRKSKFGDAYRFGLEDFLIDVGSGAELDGSGGSDDPEKARADGVQWLRDHVDSGKIDWSGLQAQVAGER